MMNVYDELPLLTEHYDDGTTIDLWVTFHDTPHPTLVLKNVTTAVRYRGWWSIEYTMLTNQPATAYLDAATVRMFSAVAHAPTNADLAPDTD